MFGLRLVALNCWLLVISINNYKFIFMFWNILTILLWMLIFFTHLKCTSKYFLWIACLFNLWVLCSLHAQSKLHCFLFERSGITMVWLKIQFFLGCDAVLLGKQFFCRIVVLSKCHWLPSDSITYLMTGVLNFLLALVLWTKVCKTDSTFYINWPCS
jgi:hypothetical protein